MKKEITTLKRHIISATRVFVSAFLGTITIQLTTLPLQGWKEYVVTMFTSAVIAGLSALIKIINEANLQNNGK